MKKRKVSRLNRRQRVARNLLCTMLLLFFCWLVLDCPALTLKWAFRRAEKVSLVGPSEIIDVIEGDWRSEENLLVVGESRYGYSVYNANLLKPWIGYANTSVAYREKEGEVELFSPMDSIRYSTGDVPWFLFTELPAARAQIEFSFETGRVDYYVYAPVHYCAEGEKRGDGYFLFILPVVAEGNEDFPKRDMRTAQLQFTMRDLVMANRNAYPMDVDITVRLWDGQGTLIYEEVLRNGRTPIE